jgi:molybdate/tungstate transport system ATP-binding protein
MRERVALATVLLASPRTILVDEAFANLHDRDEFIASFRRLCAQSRIDVLFSSQDGSDGVLSDHAYSISQGVTKRIR